MVFDYGEAATPCPASWSRDYNDSWNFDSHDDDTGAIEFTTELSALSSLAREKPLKAKRATTFRIHEDAGDSCDVSTGRRGVEPLRPMGRTALNKGSSMFAQPAQRLPRASKANFTVAQSPKSKQRQTNIALGTNDGSRVPVKECPLPSGKSVDVEKPKKDRDPLRRDKRRNTIYIPPEDTTMATVLMGAFSPPKTETVDAPQLCFLETQIAQKRQGKKARTTLPRRAPLESPRRVIQEQEIKSDVAGRNTGKENMPPGHIAGKIGLEKVKGQTLGIPKVNPAAQNQRSVLAPSNNKAQRGLSSHKKTPSLKQPVLKQSSVRATKNATSIKKPSPKKLERAKPRVTTSAESGGSQELEAVFEEKFLLNDKRKATPDPIAKKIEPLDLTRRIQSIKKGCPIPIQTTLNPSLYEETWLSHQEALITQLVNTVFESTNSTSSTESDSTAKPYLLQLYRDTYFTLLYKRVQASLLYGELRVPKDVYIKGNKIKDDVGIRRKFLRLWVSTYDLNALRSAAEIVVGRRIPIPQQRNTDGSSPITQKEIPEGLLRRRTEAFIEKFILRNEDMETAGAVANTDEGGLVGKAYRRTLLRSIMIIALLDKAQVMPGSVLPRQLFQTNSECKSSVAVLQAVYKILHPSARDIIRSFSRLECVFEYKQHPLAEHEYWIDNLAVDLRDGIILTRLAELLEPPYSLSYKTSDGDVSVTINTDQENWLHSQKLKTPCLSRVTKLHNVQVALDAMSSISGVCAVSKATKPEDIVDGYREKTVALLWAIVCQWGLPAIVDWADLKREIKRSNKTSTSNWNGDCTAARAHFGGRHQDYSSLLREWALCYTRLPTSSDISNGINNRILSNIIDEYGAFIFSYSPNFKKLSPDYEAQSEEEPIQAADLQSRLCSLGCSSQFGTFVQPSISFAYSYSLLPLMPIYHTKFPLS